MFDRTLQPLPELLVLCGACLRLQTSAISCASRCAALSLSPLQLPPDTRDKIRSQIAGAIDEQEGFEINVSFVGKDGAKQWMHLQVGCSASAVLCVLAEQLTRWGLAVAAWRLSPLQRPPPTWC